MTNPIFIIAVLVCFLVLICIINKSPKRRLRNNFTNAVGETDKKKVIGYWNDYYQSDTRSKCFDCDRTSKFKHGSNCFDCEIKGGRKVDKFLNKVLTR
jgi:hypothetical protein